MSCRFYWPVFSCLSLAGFGCPPRETMLRSSGRNRAAALWLLRGGPKQVLSPVNVAVFVRLTNTQDVPAMLVDLSMEMRDTSGKWQRMQTLDPRFGRLFFA